MKKRKIDKNSGGQEKAVGNWAKLGDVARFEFGTRITRGANAGTQYPVYGGGGESFRTDLYNRENDYVISRFAMSPNCVRFVKGKFFLLDSGLTLSLAPEFADRVSKHFVGFFLLSIQHQIYRISRGQAQKNLDSERFRKIEIPMPPLSEQRRIAAQLRQELQNCDEICRAVESRIDRIRALFSAWVRIVFDKFERASWVKFSDIAEINPRRGSFEGRLKNEEMATFIPMSAVDSTAGEVSNPLVRPFSEVCKGYTFFRDGDVLFAKITPCMQNGNHFVAKNGINGFGFASTEFYVIRSGNMVLPEWIHLFIRQPSILRAAMRQFRGSAGQQRVPPKFLADLRIPLPPIPRQRRIVAQARDQFQDWQKLTASANTQLESARALPQAFLRRAFS